MGAPGRLTGLLQQLRPAPAPASHAAGGGNTGGDGAVGGVPKRPPTAGESALAQAEHSAYTAGWPEHIPPPAYKHVPRFAVGDERVLEYLDEHGYAVVADVVIPLRTRPLTPGLSPHPDRLLTAAVALQLSPGEVALALDKIWDFNEGMGTGVDRHDPATWNNEQWVENAADVNGRGTFGLGLTHSEALWYYSGDINAIQILQFVPVFGPIHGMYICRSRYIRGIPALVPNPQLRFNRRILLIMMCPFLTSIIVMLVHLTASILTAENVPISSD